jgi:phage shock protein PspC (stress-responsive transcriptional regulator)
MEKKMKRRDYHHHHHHHHTHDYAKRERTVLRTAKPDGFIKRTIKGLAKKFNVSNRTIIIGFIVLFIFTKIFALIAFFLAYHWVKNPGKYEDVFDRTVEKSRRAFDHMGQNTRDWNTGYQQAAAGGADPSYKETVHEEDDFDFSDLKRQFDDLEKRTGGMEEHVSSEEYKLRKEFDGI